MKKVKSILLTVCVFIATGCVKQRNCDCYERNDVPITHETGHLVVLDSVVKTNYGAVPNLSYKALFYGDNGLVYVISNKTLPPKYSHADSLYVNVAIGPTPVYVYHFGVIPYTIYCIERIKV